MVNKGNLAHQRTMNQESFVLSFLVALIINYPHFVRYTELHEGKLK
jgi:hypothetical protein